MTDLDPETVEKNYLQANTLPLIGSYVLTRVHKAPYWSTPDGVTPNIEIERTAGGTFVATFAKAFLLTSESLTQLIPGARALLATLRPELIPESRFTSGKTHYVRCTNCAEVGLAQFRKVKEEMMNQPQCGRCRGLPTPAARSKVKKSAKAAGNDPDNVPPTITPTM